MISGAWQVPSTMSSSRDFPHRFSGARITRRGACAHEAWAWVAAIHSATATAASADGRITYRVRVVWSWAKMAAPSAAGPVGVVMRRQLLRR